MMTRDLIKKAVCGAGGVLAAVVFALGLQVSLCQKFPAGQSPLDGAFFFALPLISPLVGGLASVLLFRTPKIVRRAERGVLWGSFVAANAFSILLALILFRNFDLICQDGTARWMYVYLSCVYIGIPFISLGAIVGGLIGISPGPLSFLDERLQNLL